LGFIRGGIQPGSLGKQESRNCGSAMDSVR
jgi:hypothetical protein